MVRIICPQATSPSRRTNAKALRNHLLDTHMRGCKSLYPQRSKEILSACKHQPLCLQISKGFGMQKILKMLALSTTAFVLASAIPAHAAEPVRIDANGGMQTSTSVATKGANPGNETSEPLTYKLMLAGVGAVAFLVFRRRQS